VDEDGSEMVQIKSDDPNQAQEPPSWISAALSSCFKMLIAPYPFTREHVQEKMLTINGQPIMVLLHDANLSVNHCHFLTKLVLHLDVHLFICILASTRRRRWRLACVAKD
jgi:hypothetical protein